MYGGPRIPAWHRDVIWTAGCVAVVVALITVGAAAWSRLSDAASGPQLVTTVLRATLLPGDGGGEEPSALAVRDEAPVRPDRPFEALPGSGVTVDPSEVPTFDVGDAIERTAGVWSERLLQAGREGLASTLGDATLSGQLGTMIDGPATGLVEAELAEAMLPSGLVDGSRMANWPLQASQNPGEPVQPIVGIFVTVEAAELEGRPVDEVGGVVVRRLAELTVASGADAARELVSNENLSARYEQGLVQARAAVHELFVAVLAGRTSEIDRRLADARAALAGDAPPDPGLAGLLDGVDLAGLPTEAANQRVLEALALRAWTQGSGVLDGLLERDPRASRLVAARAAVDAFGRSAHVRATRLAWSAGVLALLAVALMVVLAQGVGRLSRPGAALLLAAAPGLTAGWVLLRATETAGKVALPAGARSEGVFGELAGLLRHLLAAAPAGVARELFFVHAVLAAIGAGLVALAVLLLIFAAVRPRGRRYL